jgi:hypothetical protein
LNRAGCCKEADDDSQNAPGVAAPLRSIASEGWRGEGFEYPPEEKEGAAGAKSLDKAKSREDLEEFPKLKEEVRERNPSDMVFLNQKSN